jgi:PhnB protein
MTAIQPELRVEQTARAVEFYQAAFGATVTRQVGDGDDIVAQLAVGDAAFWVTAANPELNRFSPRAIGGTTSRTPGGGT